MALVAVLYAYNDLPDVRAEHLDAHRGFLADQDNLVLSGPTSDGSGLLVFAGEIAAVETAVDDDPFLAVGLIKERRVFEWTPVLGSWKTQLGL
ncbi:YciI family protein [Nocardioides sp. NPDC057577]|uniref:YciI family protein n=1 Tax=Nocardioides sp. NPDC057577 TaxID=3346171 RepID=UPI00366C1493